MFQRYIFVTGGAGFVGSHLVIHLVEKYPEYYIVNYDKLNYCSSLKPLEYLRTKPNYKFILGDICDPQTVYNTLKKNNIDTILHLAAESHVDLSFENPLEFSLTNVYGSHVLINAAKELNIKLFFHMSTDEIYGGAHNEICCEESSFQPSNPYAATKAAAECIVMSYWRTYKLPVVMIRANNIYGPHQYPDKVVPRFISRLLQNKKCTIHGDGQKVRNFINVSDIVNAIDTLIHKGKHGEIYNIGSDFSISILELAKFLIKKIKNVTSEDALMEHIEFVKDRVFNDNQYNINFTKVLQTGWKTKEPWETGIEKTIEWYKETINGSIWKNQNLMETN
ncbi:dTDP-D-glucose 4,6-dehydratase-like isoform X1 [Octopus sinensis]|uniref:dTDP-D-glucose 4,6-dehydratase n=1 Tax=Octopus sinensis TaxID=2607531 RepID=A0A6P7S7S6_9MOLL|nr:dTDP-D-glucose 4,6-dehydratase-like isoform X1 [Octopus sinensis]